MGYIEDDFNYMEEFWKGLDLFAKIMIPTIVLILIISVLMSSTAISTNTGAYLYKNQFKKNSKKKKVRFA